MALNTSDELHSVEDDNGSLVAALLMLLLPLLLLPLLVVAGLVLALLSGETTPSPR